MQMKDSFDDIFGQAKRVMLVFAHPDDTEIQAGGLIARLISSGKQVRVIKMTSGGKGSRENSIKEEELRVKREQEDLASMTILGIKDEDNIYMRFDDGSVDNDVQSIGKIAYQIRQFKPEVVITHNPEAVVIKSEQRDTWINHRDHRNSGKTTVDAVYPYSRDLAFFPEHFQDSELNSHSVHTLLLADYAGDTHEVFFDITDFYQQKVQALSSHQSQLDEQRVQEICDYVSPEKAGRRYERFLHVEID